MSENQPSLASTTAGQIYILSRPILYYLELTPVCNSHCPGCGNVYAPHRTQRPPLSRADWKKILGTLSESAQRLILTGGEPTLHPEFAEIVADVDELGKKFTLFTNALWQEPAHVINILKQARHCTGLLISLHGADAEAHEAYGQVPGAFETVTQNIRMAVAAGLTISINAVLTRYNCQQVSQIAALSQSLGAHYATFGRYLGNALPELEPQPEVLRQAVIEIEEMRQTGERVKFGNCIPQCFVSSGAQGCLAGVAYGTIDPWGNLRPCNHADLLCGNLLELPLEEAWHSAAMQRWQGLLPPACQNDCAAFSICHGGCRATALARALQQDPLMTAPLSAESLPPPAPMPLHPTWRPVRHYEAREEAFGYVLLGAGIALVTPKAIPLLDRCDGTTTLREIEADYGQAGLALVAKLSRQGLLELKSAAGE